MQRSDLHPLVTIGASAGGLQAIRLLLQNLSPSTAASFIIIQHLLANHESILPDLLERETEMKVFKVENGMKIEPNCVYVIPPDKFMGIVDSKLTLSPREKKTGGIHSIDHFLSDLAPIYQGKAIAVILSGTANDGTAGVRAIKAEGGISFAQDDTAAFQGMPHNAIDSGYIDFVLPLDRIAREVGKAILMGMYKRSSFTRIESIEKNEAELRKIHLLLLLNRHGVDFSVVQTNDHCTADDSPHSDEQALEPGAIHPAAKGESSEVNRSAVQGSADQCDQFLPGAQSVCAHFSKRSSRRC